MKKATRITTNKEAYEQIVALTERFAKLEKLVTKIEAVADRCADLQTALANLIDAVDDGDKAAINRALDAARGLTVVVQ